MSEQALGFGIVGLSMGADRAAIAARTPGARLACVCDLQAELAAAMADKHGCEWTTDYEQMLKRDDIEVVGVFTPSGWHCDFVIAALEAGKHAFTTKPMDIRVEKCDGAIRAARETDKVLAVDFGSRYDPITHQIRMAVRAGRLGQILLGDLRMKWWRSQDYYDGGYPPGWRSRRQTEGGSIANQGVHYVDLLQWWLGPVNYIHARSGTFAHDIETEDMTLVMLEFLSGAWGTITTTTASWPDLGTTIEITGKEGTIIWGKSGGLDLYKTQQNPEASLDEFGVDPELPHNIIEDMMGAIRRGRKPLVDGEEGRKSVAIFCAAYESARRGHTVSLG